MPRPAACVLLWVALASAGLAGCSDPEPDPSAAGVGVVADACGLAANRGSGVALTAPDLVVTVAHTLKGARGVTVIDWSGAEWTAEVLWFDPNSDIAVLHVPGLQNGALPLAGAGAAGERAERDDSGLLLVWNRDKGVHTKAITVNRRITVTIEDIYLDQIVTRNGIEVAGEVIVGDSGGAIVIDGLVTGIIYASSRSRDGVGFALDESELQRALAGARGNRAAGVTADTGVC